MSCTGLEVISISLVCCLLIAVVVTVVASLITARLIVASNACLSCCHVDLASRRSCCNSSFMRKGAAGFILCEVVSVFLFPSSDAIVVLVRVMVKGVLHPEGLLVMMQV